MTYMMTANTSGGYDVHTQGVDGLANGPARNKKPMSNAAAKQYMAALYANENKSMSDLELVALEEKCYSDYGGPYVNTLSPDDPRVNYDPMGGRAGDRACANCRWFHPGAARCDLIYGDIVASGVSDLWLAKELPEPANSINPMPVYIVDPLETGGAALDSKAEPLRMFSALKERLTAEVDRISSALLNPGKKAGPPPEYQAESGFKVYDSGRWVAWYSNTAKDRAAEWFPAQATDSFIKRVKGEVVPYPELWHKHLPVQMGRADFLARIGYFTFATGTFYDTPTGRAGKAYYEAEQKAGRPKTMSHGFLFPKNMKANGEYRAYNTFEISPLDPGEECNPYTNFEVKAMFLKLDTKGVAELEKIFGKDEAAKLINFGETKSQELEAAGVSLKSFEEFGNVEVTDTKAHAAVKALAEATVNGLKQLSGQIDTLIADVASVKTAAESSQTAVDGLKTYVDQQFGLTPRSSQSASEKAKANPTQIDALKKAAEEAGKAKGDADPSAAGGGNKSVFDFILEAAGGPQA